MAAAATERKHWTYADILLMPDDGKRYELVDGELYEMPEPNESHQRGSRNLIVLFLPAIADAGAEWFHAPTDVFLRGFDRVVQPNLFVLLPAGRWRRSERGMEGAPDLVIEILSPATSTRDRELKRGWYAEAGVREYWLVSPEAGTIEVLVLEGEAYRRRLLAGGEDEVTSTVLRGLSFPASAVFAS